MRKFYPRREGGGRKLRAELGWKGLEKAVV
jgi:hypothetical protein